MPVNFKCEVFSVDCFTSKNGAFGCNVTLLDNESRKKLELFIKDEKDAKILEKMIGQEVEICIELNQTRFGLMFGELLDVKEVI